MLARLETLGRHEERGGAAGPGPDMAPEQEEGAA
jgi:hypothetical protein